MKKIIIISAISLSIFSVSSSLFAKITITGDSVVQNKTNSTISVSGNAKALKNNSTLRAQNIIYNQSKKTLSAKGQVQYTLGEDVSIEAKDLLLQSNGDMQASKVQYTSCRVSERHSNSWEISASHLDRDVKKKRIHLTNATLNIYGTPIYYWPYINQPEPKVKKAEGWLTPNGGTKTTLGAFITNEYYMPIGSSTDLSLIPTLSNKGGATLQSIYTARKPNSVFYLNHAYTYKSDAKDLTFISMNYTKVLPKKGWKVGLQFENTSNDNYTKEYVFLKQKEKDYLKSHLFAERTTKNSFLSVSATQYRDIRLVKSKRINIFPQLEYQTQIFSPKHIAFVKNKTILRSVQVADTGRMDIASNTLEVSKHKYLDNGLVVTPSLGLRSDIISYKNKHSQMPSDPKYLSGSENRFLPSASIVVALPLLATKKDEQHLLEPIVGVFVSKGKNEKPFMKNFDSNDFDLNESNIFAKNRYAGLDKIDTDKRLAYGVRLKSWLPENLYIQGFIGQSATITNKKTYSDYIGNFRIEKGLFDFSSSFEIDSRIYKVRKLETSSNFTYRKARIGLALTQTNPRPESSLDTLKQIRSDVAYALNKNWTVQASNTSNYKKKSGILKQSLSLGYTTNCGCITTSLTYTKDFSVNSKKPEESFYVKLTLKSFGENTSLRDFSVVPKK